jgi:hypothetical protein
MDILCDQQRKIAGQREDAAARAPRFQLAVHRSLIIEFDELAALRFGKLRPGIQVAGDIVALAVGHQVQRLAAAQRSRPHRFDQAAHAQMGILLGQAGDLGLDDLVGLRVQGAARVPVGEGQQCRYRQGEQQHIDQHDAERLGP